MMLDPDDRSLLTAHLAPPPGFVFDAGLATTYALDPTLLLTVPLHLSGLGLLAGGGRRGGGQGGSDREASHNGHTAALPADPIALLEALRRVTERFTVFTERGGLHPARMPSPLYCLLEPMVVEVRAPNGGAFHAKIWLLRFKDPTGDGRSLLRLVISTRNITTDPCWDLVLSLDGAIGTRDVDDAVDGDADATANGPLADLIVRLPDLANALPPERRALTEALAADVRRARWELPPGVADVRFHVLGLAREPWLPAPSDQLAVIGPFLGDKALAALCGTTRKPVLLVSRADALGAAGPAVLARFARRCILEAASETEDGADDSGQPTLGWVRRGLHAKVLLAAQGGTSRIYMGSANPTDAALCFGRNVEIMAEISGPTRLLGDPDRLGDVGPASLGRLLVDWSPDGSDSTTSAEAWAAERALTAARRAIADAGLSVHCAVDGDRWQLTLVPSAPMVLNGIAAARAWPITVTASHAQDMAPLRDGRPAWVCGVAAANVTGLVAFELTSEWRPPDGAPSPVDRFALNLPLVGAPADRTGELLRAVLGDQRGFLKYLMILLGRDAPLAVTAMMAADDDHPFAGNGRWGKALESLPLLEAMTRAFVHRPEQMRSVETFVRDVSAKQSGEDIVPPAFAELWRTYAQAMGRQRR